MVYDAISTEPSSATCAPDSLEGKWQNASDPLFSVKAVGRSLVLRTKTRATAMLAGITMAAGTLCLPQPSRAQAPIIQIQQTGIVVSGTDGNPAENGAGNVFGVDSDLSGQTFTFTFKFSDPEGNVANTQGKCPDGTIYTSTIIGNNPLQAPTATLGIGHGSFTYGAGGYPLNAISWSTTRNATTPCSSNDSDKFNFGWSENYKSGYMGKSGFSGALPVSSPGPISGDWHITVHPVMVWPQLSYQFWIGVADSKLKSVKVATGVLKPQYISVSGLTPLDWKLTSRAVGQALQQYLNNVSKGQFVFDLITDPTTGPTNRAEDIFVRELQKIFGTDQINKDNVELSVKVLSSLTEILLIPETGLLPAAETVSKALKLFEISTASAAIFSNEQSADPPDPNFTVVEPPQQLSLPSSGNPQLDAALGNYMNFTSLMEATWRAGEKWQGAFLAGDKASAALQQTAYKTYSQQTADAALAIPPSNRVILANLPQPIDISTIPGGATTIATFYQAQCGQPLPSNLNAVLLGLGLSQKQIDADVCDIVKNITPTSISTDYVTPLKTPFPVFPPYPN